MRLSIGWATPWNSDSAIAKMSHDVTTQLAELGHQVEIVPIEIGAASFITQRRSPLPVRPVKSIGADELNARFDVVFVNLGNHYPYHGGALQILRNVPASIAILHDTWMGDFLYQWRSNEPELTGAIDSWSACFPDDEPILGPLLSLCCGAIVHGRHCLDQARRYCCGPVEYVPLAFTSPALSTVEPTARLRLATVGHINPNKRVDEVLHAIASSQLLRERVDYHLLGPVSSDERTRLTALARSLDVREPVFVGWLDDDALIRAMEATDVFCCLRFPVTEGGSASLVTAMLSGRPVLVSDHASYSEVPDDAVLKCIPGREAATVARHLERLIADPAVGQRSAMRAIAYALETNSPRTYAARMVKFAERVIGNVPTIRTARTVGARLGMLGVSPGHPSVTRSAAMLGGVGCE